MPLEQYIEYNLSPLALTLFTSTNQKHHENSSQFRLDDGEEQDALTHYGQSLSEIEKFEDPRLSDSEDEDPSSSGNIGAKMVANEHFGGFMTRKEEEGRGKVGDAKTWKERMEEMIAQSKKAKYERQHEREMNMEETDKLDLAWKTLRATVGGMRTSQAALEIEEESKRIDDYDLAVNELKFDLKATATDRMKTEQEIAAEEKADLEKFEEDRLRRMKGITNEDLSTEISKHKSADELDDIGFNNGTAALEKFHCSYKDGTLLKADGDQGNDDEEDEDEEDEDAGELSSDDEVDESTDEEDDAMERTSDLESDPESDDDVKTKTTKSVKFSEDLIEPQSAETIREMLKKKKEVMEKARVEIPFTFAAPSSFNDLCETLAGHEEADQLLILQRMRKCHHPSLAAGNKLLLQKLFSHELHYYGMLGRLNPPSLRLAEIIYPEIDALSRLIGPSETANSFNSIVESMYSDYCSSPELSSLHLDTMLMMMLAEKLFSVSDLKHAVSTQLLLFMSEMLTQGSIKTINDISKGLFVCEMIYKYVKECKRFVPEALNFLNGVLYMSYKQDATEVIIPPFRTVGKKFDSEALNIGKILSGECTDCSDQYKVNHLNWCYNLVDKYSKLYEYLPSYKILFYPLLNRLSKQPKANLKGKAKVQLMKIIDSVKKTSVKKIKCLATAKSKPKLIQLFEPLIADSFDGRKQHKTENQNKEFVEKQKMLHKVKREMKSAVREIRRDNEFLARRKIDDQIERDNERKTKVKRLFHLLSTQEGDHNAMQRKKHKL